MFYPKPTSSSLSPTLFILPIHPSTQASLYIILVSACYYVSELDSSTIIHHVPSFSAAPGAHPACLPATREILPYNHLNRTQWPT